MQSWLYLFSILKLQLNWKQQLASDHIPLQVLLCQATPNTQETVFEDDFVTPIQNKAPVKEDSEDSDNEVQFVGVKVKGGQWRSRLNQQPNLSMSSKLCLIKKPFVLVIPTCLISVISFCLVSSLCMRSSPDLMKRMTTRLCVNLMWFTRWSGITTTTWTLRVMLCKYDNNCWHDMPCCLLRGACRLAVDLSNCCVIQNCLCYRREGGAAKKYTKYTSN